MATREDIQNADLMKDYVKMLLSQHGFVREAKCLDSATVQCAGTAKSVASILQAMQLEAPKQELRTAKLQLIRRLEALQA